MSLADNCISLDHNIVKSNTDERFSADILDGPLTRLSDEELVIAHLQGRNGAFENLYERYHDRLIRFVARKTGDSDRAQDLVQEAFIRITRHLHRFDTTKKFSTWVFTIASNLSINELRNRSRSPLILFQKLTGYWDDENRPLQLKTNEVKIEIKDKKTKKYIPLSKRQDLSLIHI